MSPEQAQARRRRRAHRCLQPRLHDVRDAHGTAAVPRLRASTPSCAAFANRHRRRVPSVPTCRVRVDAVVARALAPHVDDRFQSTTALAEALGAAAARRAAGSGPHRRSDAVLAASAVGRRCCVGRRGWRGGRHRGAASCVDRAASCRRNSGPPGPTPVRATLSRLPHTGPTLAVLPFENVGLGNDAYFAQGVSDELTSRLTSVAGVRVMSPAARGSTATRRSRAPIGRELGADYLLDGHVRWDRADCAARRVRVTVELVRSRDGSSVWADRYEAKTEDLFTMEGHDRREGGRGAGGRARRTRAAKRFRPGPRRTSRRTPTSCAARRSAPRSRTRSTTRPRAVAMYERAVALDPKFALAFARLALTHGRSYWANTDRTAKRLALMRAAAETAVRLDPDLPEAHLALGFYYYRVCATTIAHCRVLDRTAATTGKRRATVRARRGAASSGTLRGGGGELRARRRARPAFCRRRHSVSR